LPDNIGNLSKLEHLELICNNLTGLPESIGNLSALKYHIDIYDNPLKSLPDSVSKLRVDINW
jgi:Leucine-rich repeat (LRR) protein